MEGKTGRSRNEGGGGERGGGEGRHDGEEGIKLERGRWKRSKMSRRV